MQSASEQLNMNTTNKNHIETKMDVLGEFWSIYLFCST